MKRLLLTLFLMVVSISISAQERDLDSVNNKGFEPGLGFSSEAILRTNFFKSNASVNFMGVYKFNPYIMAGMGTGLSYFITHRKLFRNEVDDLDRIMLMPLFASFRVNFLKRQVSPFAQLKVGYGFDMSERFQPFGLMFATEEGVVFRLKGSRISNHIGISTEFYRYEDYKTIITIGLVMGISF